MIARVSLGAASSTDEIETASGTPARSDDTCRRSWSGQSSVPVRVDQDDVVCCSDVRHRSTAEILSDRECDRSP